MTARQKHFTNQEPLDPSVDVSVQHILKFDNLRTLRLKKSEVFGQAGFAPVDRGSNRINSKTTKFPKRAEGGGDGKTSCVLTALHPIRLTFPDRPYMRGWFVARRKSVGFCSFNFNRRKRRGVQSLVNEDGGWFRFK